MKKLTPKQEKFCQLYVELGNASDAYRQAYNVDDNTLSHTCTNNGYKLKTQFKTHIDILKAGNNIEFTPIKKPTKGYIYLLHLEGFDFYKIGISQNVPSRLKQMKTLVPFNISRVKTIHIENYRDVEKQIHSKLDRYRYKGEWFKGCLGVILKEFNKYD